ncbi:hypothetical protein Sango_2888700 [Sesamum angolense]|uniref:Retroviral polymerase SH3-like domain-containing protein n=1 Tax=Sesamum angolense TaxID=2727404 RepID=A0AAE1T6A4_9LAMI|nr:hypothetical protein Sango_2888700 [Sesamum angolense]
MAWQACVYKYLRVWGSPANVKTLEGDKLDSSSSLCRFVGYSEETTGYHFYDPSEQKIFISRNAVFLLKGFPVDSRRDEVLLEESSEAPQQNDATSFEPSVPTDGVPVLHRSVQPLRPPTDRLTIQDIRRRNAGHRFRQVVEAMKSAMDLMGSNQFGP